jgi:hypothetical protein
MQVRVVKEEDEEWLRMAVSGVSHVQERLDVTMQGKRYRLRPQVSILCLTTLRYRLLGAGSTLDTKQSEITNDRSSLRTCGTTEISSRCTYIERSSLTTVQL